MATTEEYIIGVLSVDLKFKKKYKIYVLSVGQRFKMAMSANIGNATNKAQGHYWKMIKIISTEIMKWLNSNFVYRVVIYNQVRDTDTAEPLVLQ